MEMIKLKQHYLPINIHKSVISLNIVFDNVSNKKHPSASLLGCAFNDRLTGELMTLNAKRNKKSKVYFETLWYKHSDYACSTWYPNSSTK